MVRLPSDYCGIVYGKDHHNIENRADSEKEMPALFRRFLIVKANGTNLFPEQKLNQWMEHQAIQEHKELMVAQFTSDVMLPYSILLTTN